MVLVLWLGDLVGLGGCEDNIELAAFLASSSQCLARDNAERAENYPNWFPYWDPQTSRTPGSSNVRSFN
jgi:hypothetical protein